MYIVIALLFCFSTAYGTTRDRLWHVLMSSYVKDLKPDGVVVVKHGISLQGIRSFEDGVLTAYAWINQEWNDSRLQWNPEDFDQIEYIRVPARLLWKPDVLLENIVGSDSGMIYSDLNAVVKHNGIVFYVPVMRLVSQCEEQGKIKKSVDCKWKFGSWTYSGYDINLLNGTDAIDMSNLNPNPKIEVKSSEITRHVVYYECCPEPYPELTYTIELQKNFGL